MATSTNMFPHSPFTKIATLASVAIFAIGLLVPSFADAQAFNSTVDYYAVLGVSQGATEAEIKSAFRQKAKALHPDSNRHSTEEQLKAYYLIVEAKAVLSDEQLKQTYDQTRKSMHAAGSAGRHRPGTRPSFNLTGNRAKSADYFRLNPTENGVFIFGFNEDVPSVYRDIYVRHSEWTVSSQWQQWEAKWRSGAAPDLSEIKNKFSSLSGVPTEEEIGFLRWWFSLSISHDHRDWAIELLEKGYPRLNHEVAMQSLASESWQQVTWLDALMKYPKARIASFEALGRFDVPKPDSFIDDLFDTASAPEIDAFFVGFFSDARNIAHPDWALRFLRSYSSACRSFLWMGGAGGAWILHHPEIVTEAINRIIKLESSGLENIVIPLANPLSARHPEWLKLLVDGAKANPFYQRNLNQILALDHWQQHPAVLSRDKKTGEIQIQYLLGTQRGMKCEAAFDR